MLRMYRLGRWLLSMPTTRPLPGRASFEQNLADPMAISIVPVHFIQSDDESHPAPQHIDSVSIHPLQYKWWPRSLKVVYTCPTLPSDSIDQVQFSL